MLMDARPLAANIEFYRNSLGVDLRISFYVQNGSNVAPMQIRFIDAGSNLGARVAQIPALSGKVISTPISYGWGFHSDQAGHFQLLQFH